MPTKEQQQTLLNVPIEKVKPATDNPRKRVGDVAELAQSVASAGVIEPLVVVAGKNGDYTLVAGSRRLAAAKLAKLVTVPAILRVLEDKERIEIMLAENLHREDLTPVEEAETYKRLIDDCGYTQRTLADRVGKSQPHISKRLALLQLPAPVKKEIDSGEIPVGDAIALTALKEKGAAKQIVADHKMRPFQSIESMVVQTNREHDVEQKVAAARKLAKDKGWPFIEREKVLFTDRPAALPIGKASDHYVYGGAMTWVDAKKHESEKCHAITVDREGDVIPLCNTPKNHPAPKGQQAAARETRAARLTPKEKAFEAHQKEMTLSRKEREAFAAEMLGKRLPSQVRSELIVRGLLHSANSDPVKLACKLMGLDPVEEKGYSPGSTVKNYGKALAKFAGSSAENLQRVGAAVAVSYAELALQSGYVGESGLAADYVKLLKSQGYKPSKAETTSAAGKAPQRY